MSKVFWESFTNKWAENLKSFLKKAKRTFLLLTVIPNLSSWRHHLLKVPLEDSSRACARQQGVHFTLDQDRQGNTNLVTLHGPHGLVQARLFHNQNAKIHLGDKILLCLQLERVTQPIRRLLLIGCNTWVQCVLFYIRVSCNGALWHTVIAAGCVNPSRWAWLNSALRPWVMWLGLGSIGGVSSSW